MNKGLSPELKLAFPQIKPSQAGPLKIEAEPNNIPNPNWVAFRRR